MDLNPAQIQGINGQGGLIPLYGSVALGVSGSQQVGYAVFGSRVSQTYHALLWNGTAGSAVDLNPSQAFTFSRAVATNGTLQVGNGQLAPGGPFRALAWSGAANSAVDLQALLPPNLVTSFATSVDSAGDVFGVANDAWVNGLAAGRYYALEWLPHAVVPGDVNLDGKVDFADLVTLARNYGQAGGWLQGDFNSDGNVGFEDLTILARNYGQALTGAQLGQLDPSFRADVERAFAEVPEPCCLSLLSLGASVLLRRCRR